MPHPILQRILAVLFALLMIFAVLITAVESVVYWTPGWFETEYTKYEVLDELEKMSGKMSMDDALYVTDEMMQYLRGGRKDLIVMTTIDGEATEFYSAREKRHLADCRRLFIGAIRLRWLSLAGGIAIALALARINRSARRMLSVITKAFTPASVGIAVCTAAIGGIVSTDFDHYFNVFHHLLFDNNDWILYPRQDLLINLLPEEFFIDTGLRILITFLIAMLLLCTLAIITHRKLAEPICKEA